MDGGSRLDLIAPDVVNQLEVPWGPRKRACVVTGPFRTQLALHETEPLDITVKGKTTQVVFTIVDMGPDKEMILGRPWHKEYDPDIS